MNSINEISGWREEAKIDFVCLWQIATDVKNQDLLKNTREVREGTLKIVRSLIAEGVSPGDYSFEETSFIFWTGTVEEQLDRIESEWVKLGKIPNIEQPICWFALPPSDFIGKPMWKGGKWLEGK